jgi:hypothetical protein
VNWTVTRTDKQCVDIDFDCSQKKKFSALLLADEHADNAHSDLALIRKHHAEAVSLGAPILKFGDTFCAMEGKWDRRASESALRPEMRGGNYLDKLVSFHTDLYLPYAKNIAVVSDGNHETAILKHHQTDLLERLTQNLRTFGAPCEHMPFTGFVRFKFDLGNRHRDSKTLHYHHGYGGGGEVTRGMIDNSRTRGQYSADIYISGHIHRRNSDENVMISVNGRGHVVQQPQLFLRAGTYKREEMGGSGYHTEKGRSARPVGGWWLDFEISRDRNNTFVDVNYRSAK